MESDMTQETFDDQRLWIHLPEPLVLYIFSHLKAKDLLSVRQVCRVWCRIASDEFLWKKLFYTDFKISKSIPISPGQTSWWSEYKRLRHHTPVHQTEVLTNHTHQVLHISFSHNGRMFASCSKDGFIKVWKSTYPAVIHYVADMKLFTWNYTQFSQFNESDTLLLVSGVHFGAHTASGEIAVFNLTGNFTLQCRVLNKPYDIFGTWYTNDYLLSGRLHFLGHLVSCSALWLNKAWQESESEKKPIIKRLFKFFNKKASSIRTIMVANCLSPSDGRESSSSRESSIASRSGHPEAVVHGNPVSHNALSSSPWPCTRTTELASGCFGQEMKVNYSAECKEACTMDSPIRYSEEYRRVESAIFVPESDDDTSSDTDNPFSPMSAPLRRSSAYSLGEESTSSSDSSCGRAFYRAIVTPPPYSQAQSPSYNRAPPSPTWPTNADEDSDDHDTGDSLDEDASSEKILDPREKYLIFTTGSLTYTPHQIGFKRIKPLKFVEKVSETPSLSQRIAEQQERSQEPQNSPNWQDEQNVMQYFDKADHVIDMHGHIIGMGLSPDHRYLYVNSRPWPQNYVIENPLIPPPIAQEIDIHVIDLYTLKEVGTMLRSHKAYTPNDECFFIFLDVSNQYVASGAEDKHGYLWDRHYGNCLAKLPHNDVVNSVAFNPSDPEMLVTASDDFTLKVWRSGNRMKELNIKPHTSVELDGN